MVQAGRMAAPWFARLVAVAHVLMANEPAHLSVDQRWFESTQLYQITF